MRLKFQSKTTLFFERLRVRINRGKREMIYSLSGYIATSIKRSIRARPGSARAGAAPHAHTTRGLRVVQFNVQGNSSIIGPIKFPSSNRFNEPVTFIHETGAQVIEWSSLRIFNYPKRPYVSTTLARIRKKLPRRATVSLAKVL